MYFILIFFGSYINFMSRVKWIKSLYKFKDCNLNSKIDKIDPQSLGDQDDETKKQKKQEGDEV